MKQSPKKITPKDINLRNSKFWKETNELFETAAKDYPHAVVAAATLTDKLIKAGHISDPDFAQETSMVSQVLGAEEVRAKDRSVASAQAGKKKAGKTNETRALVIEAISRYRGNNNDHSFEQFLDIMITTGSSELTGDMHTDDNNKKRYVITLKDTPSLIASDQLRKNTLKTYWKEARC